MDCQDIKLKIYEYLDGDLPEAESQSMDRHIAGCPSCRERLDEEKKMGHWLGFSAQRRLERFLAAGPAPKPEINPARRRLRLAVLLRPLLLASLLMAALLLLMIVPIGRQGGGCSLTTDQMAAAHMSGVIAIEDDLAAVNEVIIRSNADGRVATIRIDIEIQ